MSGSMSIGSIYQEYIYYYFFDDDLRIAFLPIKDAAKQVLCGDLMRELGDFFDDFNGSKTLHQLVKGEIYIDGFNESFACGANIKEFEKILGSRNIFGAAYKFSRLGQQTLLKIHNCVKPITAVIHGYTLGGGLELAMACRKRIAHRDAVLGYPETTLGLIPGWGGTQWPLHDMQWPLSDIDKTFKNIFGQYLNEGGSFDVNKAMELKIVSNIMYNYNDDVPRIPKSKPYSKYAASLIDDILTHTSSEDLEDGLKYESVKFAEAMVDADAREGITAFLEKRPPKFHAVTD